MAAAGEGLRIEGCPRLWIWKSVVDPFRIGRTLAARPAAIQAKATAVALGNASTAFAPAAVRAELNGGIELSANQAVSLFFRHAKLSPSANPGFLRELRPTSTVGADHMSQGMNIE
jgi:hypothetical protein